MSQAGTAPADELDASDEPRLALAADAPATHATSFEVVAAVARLVAARLPPREVFEGMAEAARGVLQSARMGVLLLEGDSLRHHTVVAAGAGGAGGRDGRLTRRADCSPRLWDDFVVDRIDARQELDVAHERDREILESGIRSIIRGVLRSGSRNLGVLAFYSREPKAFSVEHEPLVAALADLAAAALEQDRIFTLERERSRRVAALEALLPTLARALDIRQVFTQVSEITQGAIAHDLLVLSLLRPDGASVVTQALLPDGELEELPPPSEGLLNLYQGGAVIRDIEIVDPATRRVKMRPLSAEGDRAADVEIGLDAARFRHATQTGVRSLVAVPLQDAGRFVGGLLFLSCRPAAYRPEHADLARRVADHVALALAHQRLSEEERRTGHARVLAARLVKKVESLKQEIESLGPRRRIVGDSPAWKHALRQATQVAATDTTALLLGESGTGKEVVARFIHRASPRAEGPYLAVNCAALPDQLLEAELFGYERGAFTGAVAAKPGLVERAARGVLFLDEVGEMSLAAQAKLLRVLQEKEFQRLGGTRLLTADVRIVAATNRDLRAAVEARTFREDLYYRLHVFEIRLPPLRERPEDIPSLCDEFLAEIGQAFGRLPARLSPDARELLLAHDWPGNTRELRNVLERAAIVCEGDVIGIEHLSLEGPRARSAPRLGVLEGVAEPRLTTAADLKEAERGLVEKALQDARYNKSDAARALGLTRKQLYVRLRRFGLE